MMGLISTERMGFVEGRKILDEIVLNHEMIHFLKQTKAPGMLIKVDLAMAYDKVSWWFLKAVLKAFGFQHDWVLLMLQLREPSLVPSRLAEDWRWIFAFPRYSVRM